MPWTALVHPLLLATFASLLCGPRIARGSLSRFAIVVAIPVAASLRWRSAS